MDLPLTIAEATLGTQTNVPTVDGMVRLTVPPGTSSGTKLRLRGKGIKRQGGVRGDQICHVQIVVPIVRSDDAETRRLVEELNRRAGPASVRNF
jgi:curved DNA-binding protein